jgi:hypothetical protein
VAAVEYAYLLLTRDLTRAADTELPRGCGTWGISHCPVNVLRSSLTPRRTASTGGATAHLIRFLFENLSLLLKQT